MGIPPTTSVLMGLPDGEAGIIATLRIMRKVVRTWKKSTDLRDLALAHVKGCAQKDWACQINALTVFVRDRIRYVRDINGVETVMTPAETLRRGQGDCDDKSILLAAMLESIGHPARFVAVGVHHHPYSHVYVETRMGNGWIGLETTEPWAPGRVVPNQTSRLTWRI